MDLVERIIELRKERQWSEYHLAKEAGISQSTLSNLINRGNNPSVYTLEKIAHAFGLTLSQFFNTDEERMYVTGVQKELLEYWNCMDRIQREKTLSYIKGLLNV